jgi:hypothetical protein
MLNGRPCPQQRSRGGGARRRPAGEAVEEGGRSVVEVAGVHAVLREAAVGSGGGWLERPIDVDGLSDGWSRWWPVTSGRPLVRRLVGEVAHAKRRVARLRVDPR